MNWGQANLSVLIYRAQLEYWRGRQKDAPAYAFETAQKVWDHKFRDHFIDMVNLGSWPDVVSGFPDILPFKIDLRDGALQHDIDYWLGGDEQARRNADLRLYKWIVERYEGPLKRIVSSYVWIAVRIFGRRKKHFCYTNKGDA